MYEDFITESACVIKRGKGGRSGRAVRLPGKSGCSVKRRETLVEASKTAMRVKGDSTRPLGSLHQSWLSVEFYLPEMPALVLCHP